MAEQRADLAQALRRVSEANLRYYEALGKVTVDYWTALFGVLGEVAGRGPTAVAAPVPAPPATPEPAAPAAAPGPAMVLEAPVGGQAIGAFLVENRLAKRVSAPVVASTFVAEDGREVRPRLTLDPEVVTLEPGEQVLVRVLAPVDEQIESGVTYRGGVSVPGLSGGNVRLVLRRRAESPPPSESPARARGTPARAGATRHRTG